MESVCAVCVGLVLYLWRASARGRPPLKRVRAMAVLGSGGHTAEMLRLLPSLCSRAEYSRLDFVLAETDRSSRASAEQLRDQLARSGHPLPPISFLTIPRSREVGQSYVSSIFSTLRAIAASALVVVRRKPDLILCNGPGTCLPVCLIARALHLLTLRTIVIVYVESMARVRSLSLTGRVVWTLGLAGAFFVQWEGLQERYRGTVFRGRLC